MINESHIVPYDPSWPDRYREEAVQLKAILQQEITAIHHIGSTSISGMHAKPIIDILIEVREINQITAYNQMMADKGYIPKGEYGIKGRRYFVKGSEEQHTHHIHVYEHGNPDVARHLNFRDYLRAHPEDAERYRILKIKLGERYPEDRNAYQVGKTEMIKELEQKSELWKASTGK